MLAVSRCFVIPAFLAAGALAFAAQAPAPPSQLDQLTTGGASIPVGGTTSESSVQFRGLLQDPGGAVLRLDVELQPIGNAFTGIPTASGPFVPSGNIGVVSIG